MRKMHKIILPLVAAVLSLTSCGGEKKGGSQGGYDSVYNVNDGNRTVLTLTNFGGGIGHLWIDKAADRFAGQVIDKSYGGGHKGVYIQITSTFNENTNTMDNGGTDIYFDERESDITELGGRGLLLNLDEVYLDTTREGGTLESKLFDSVKGSVTAKYNGQTHYYGLPHYEYYGGLSYNRLVFNDKRAYFADASEIGGQNAIDFNYKDSKGQWKTAYFVGDGAGKKSTGPDGLYNTEDDGLPRSAEELLILCQYINTIGISPFVISGQHAKNYADYIIGGLWANLAGTQQMRNYYDCSGTIDVVKRDSSGNVMFTNDSLFDIEGISLKKPVIEQYTFNGTGKDGYKGNDMAAKFYAYALLDIIKAKGYFNVDSKINTRDHYMAQQNLLWYRVNNIPYKPAAMLIDGSYWYNEANEKGSLKQYAEKSGNSESSLDCRFMALPVAYDNSSFVGREQCLLDMGHSYGMINAKVANSAEKKQAAIDFIKFLYSEEELKKFTLQTGMPRMIKTNLTEEDKEAAGSFYKHMFNLRDDNGANLIALGSEKSYWPIIRNTVRIAMGKTPFSKDGQTVWLMLEANKHAEEIFNFFSNGVKSSACWSNII